MIKNYITTALRRFKRHKSSFLINVTGLSIGMACSILILLWVIDELNYDHFHTHSDRIYQVMENQAYSGSIFTTNSTPGILAPALKKDFPEIQYVCSYTWNMKFLFTKGEKSFKEDGIYARPELFHILTFPLLSGNIDELLTAPHSVVISSKLAKKYFGNLNPIGKAITINNETVHTITGVFKDIPENSSLKFDYVLPFEDWLSSNEWATEWGNNGPKTLIMVNKNTDIKAFNTKLKDYIKGKNEGSVVNLFAYPYADQYLYGKFENGKVVGGRIDYVRLFSVVAIFILLIACINFMNLSTAKATKRAKEVGIRKSIGASKASLTGQFIGESMLISFFSLAVSVLLVYLFLPVFNTLTDKHIELGFSDPSLLMLFIGVAVITGLAAGSYPAFYLSSFEAVKTLKGSIHSSGRMSGEVLARKGLVVFQFMLSIVLIISTIVVYKQIQYAQTKNLGYNKENLVAFPIEGELNDSWEAFRQQLITLPGVTNVSRASATFMGRNSSTSGLEWPGKDPDTKVLFENVSVDYGLIKTLGFTLAEGRTFSRNFGADTSRILINQAAAKAMGMQHPAGKTITLWERPTEIIGVVNDFNFQTLRYGVEPLFIRLAPQNTWRAYIRVGNAHIRETIARIKEVYKKFNPNYPFDYDFMDQQYAALYRSEMRVGALAKYFSVFAIFISCLGLFGLSAFTAEQRAKEIGVRKVLGASVRRLVLLLTGDFTKLVGIAILIGIPVSWYAVHKWIGGFAYQTDIEWWIFAVSGLLALVIAWLTVSWQSIKAALANPVDSLRSE